MPMPVVVVLLLLIAGIPIYRYLAMRRARARLLATALPAHQRAALGAAVPLIRRLPPDLRGKLEGKINAFLKQVEFIGCNGLDVTDRMRLAIAAQACLLVVNRDDWYDHLRTVLLYPGAFKSMDRQHRGYVVTERETVRSGESWIRGPVVLSWADAERGAAGELDGRNVVFHEFAHQLDGLSGDTDGVPVLESDDHYANWGPVFTAAYDAHVRRVEQGRWTVLDAYGAEAPEEFFAVAVELFFERPGPLAGDEPEVYAELVRLFRLDPLSWQ